VEEGGEAHSASKRNPGLDEGRGRNCLRKDEKNFNVGGGHGALWGEERDEDRSEGKLLGKTQADFLFKGKKEDIYVRGILLGLKWAQKRGPFEGKRGGVQKGTPPHKGETTH